MSYLGRKMLGDELIIVIQTMDSSGTPTTPVSAPTSRLYLNGTFKKSVRIPIRDRDDVTGLFTAVLFLGATFAVGNYDIVHKWTIGSDTFQDIDRFEIVAGGSAKGTIIAMYPVMNPAATFLINQRTDGVLSRGTNPRL